ncbi:MAG: ABC transporter substrate-binding protein [Chroococcidiopsidaceae cyanobacterium CP_BM_ER_R8_30]|nr:ABC transporter substrate-binding protein [Chroococcidiopsidaceae cyanobacterium CP_BM_ER_R8_30]
MTKVFRRWFMTIGVIVVIVPVALIAVSCANRPGERTQAGSQPPEKVVITYQPGIGYANLVIVKQQKTLEKQFLNTQITWKTLSSGSAVRDGMVAKQVQVGAGGISPFLVGWDRGVKWKILAALSRINIWLVVKNPQIKSLADFKPGMKIGLPAPDSEQALILRRAAQKQLGNPNALDNNLQAIAHPLGVQALLQGQIAGHFTNVPFQFQEVEQGGKVILKSNDVFGPSTSSSVYMLEDFYNQYPDFANALYNALSDATKLLNENPDEAAKLLAQDAGGKATAEQFKKWITNDAIKYNLVPKGFLEQAKFMREIGMISRTPESAQELFLPPVQNVGGD